MASRIVSVADAAGLAHGLARDQPAPDGGLSHPVAREPVAEPDFAAPDFSGSRRTRIGSSFIEQFVAGHDASDVLRELVQNEFDGGGDTLTLTFGSQALEVAGSGRGIGTDGWERLSVIVGTGSVVGSAGAESVAAKTNGIGSKNFGLRSLFRFGDRIYVRSRGKVGLLDLTTQETGLERDVPWDGWKGVRLNVPYRTTATERLEAFTVERERHALALMEARMPDTLLKLALEGKRRGLRKVTIQSIRTGRTLAWRQEAKAVPTKLRGVNVVARKGRLATGAGAANVCFEEMEFSKAVAIPAKYAGRAFPAYYRSSSNRLTIGVSMPMLRRRADLGQQGWFYYPLKTPTARTGCAISVSAPFELNNDRSGLADHEWNEWLIDEAVELTMAFLKTDWFGRFGAGAYKALADNGSASPDRFITSIRARLAADACWPTAAKGVDRFAPASAIVLPQHAALGGFLSDREYLDVAISEDDGLRALAKACGAKAFSIGSLIRLRCAKQDDKAIATRLGGDANYHFGEYEAVMSDVTLQVRQAAALSDLARQLSNQNRADLRNSASTLSFSGELRPAHELLLVPPELWAECPEPERNRLHPDLVAYKAVARYCRQFDEERWLVDAAARAATAADDDPERETLYRKLLTRTAPIGRAAAAALRISPVLRDQRAAWAAPADLVALPAALGRLLDPFVQAPAREVLAAAGLVARLRIRERLGGDDLARLAAGLTVNPALADRFERLATDNLRLLSPGVVQQIRSIPCLKARSGRLAPPKALHLDTPANRVCIADDDRIVARNNETLHAKLKIRGEPGVDTMLEILGGHRTAGTPPSRPDLLYPALVDAMRRERRPRRELAAAPICWIGGVYHAPQDVLVGARTAAPLAEAIPVHRTFDATARAFGELGASTTPSDAHWTRFFVHVANRWTGGQPIEPRRRRLLAEAYYLRGHAGLPAGLDDAACLMDDRGRLFSLVQLRAHRLVEPDFPELQRALREADSKVGVVDTSERSLGFFYALGIRPLSYIAGAGEPQLGDAGRAPLWYKAKHGERVLALLHRPIFARALYELARRHRSTHGFAPADADAVAARVAAIHEVAFFKSIKRRYTVDGVAVQVEADVAVAGARIGLIAPRTKQEFQFLLADALAEIAGASSAAAVRALAGALLPLVLCTTSEDLRVYLDRVGFSGHARWGGGADAEQTPDFDDDDDAEDALRQVFDGLVSEQTADDPPPVKPVPPRPASTSAPTPSPPPAPPPLPELAEVILSVDVAVGTKMESRVETGTRGGGSGVWFPPTAVEVERAAELGRRGEALLYQLELERVRCMGHSDPEAYVVWTSRDDPGADHDIRSIDEECRVRWLAVKSTTGVDGRFEWSRREFEKALRERDRYELWRIYQVAGRTPVAKCFRNPAKMIGAKRIVLELGTLRANIEGLR